MPEIPAEIREAAHKATVLPFARAMTTSPYKLIDMALDAAAPRLTEAYDDLLGSIWLYINWRYVTKQLTTAQKELLADAVDRDVMRSQREDGEEPRPVAERWWRDA